MPIPAKYRYTLPYDNPVDDFEVDENWVTLEQTFNNLPIDYGAIYNQTLSAATASITINIPTGFTSMRIEASVISTAVTNLTLRFNGDTGANYSNEYIMANTGAAPATVYLPSGGGGDTYLRPGFCTDVSTRPGNAVISIFQHSNPNVHKQMVYTFDGWYAAGAQCESGGGYWANTAVITSITLAPLAGSFSAQSNFRVALGG